MKARYFLAAENAIIDRDSNNISMFQVLEQLNSVSFPVLLPKMVCATCIERQGDEPDVLTARLDVRNNGELLLSLPGTTAFAGKSRLRLKFSLDNIFVHAQGKLQFELFANDSPLAIYDIEVTANGA